MIRDFISQHGGNKERRTMIFFCCLSFGLSVSPAQSISPLAFMLAALAAMVAAVPLFVLLRRFPGFSLFEICADLFPKFLSVILSWLGAALCLIALSASLRGFMEVSSKTMLRETPGVYVLALTLIPALYAAHKGFRTVMSLMKILLPLILLFTAVIFLPQITGIDLGASVGDSFTVPGILRALPPFLPVLLVTAFGWDKESGVRSGLWPMFEAGAALCLITLITVSKTYGYAAGNPLALMADAAELPGNIIERQDFFALSSLILLEFGLGAMSILAAGRLLGLKKYGQITAAAVCFLLSLFPLNVQAVYSAAGAAFIIMLVVVPLLCLLVSVSLGKKGGDALEK